MSEFLLTVLATVIGSLISAGIVGLALGRWGQRRETRVLRACHDLARGDLNAPVARYEIANRTNVPELEPILAGLLLKEWLIKHPDRPDCVAVTPKGREVLQRRNSWHRLIGG